MIFLFNKSNINDIRQALSCAIGISINHHIYQSISFCTRNFLFSKFEKGAESSTILFSLLQTARANGLVPELYLEYVIDNINKVDHLEDLLPWSDKIPSNIKIVL